MALAGDSQIFGRPHRSPHLGYFLSTLGGTLLAMTARAVYISGVHSGPNPSPGLGVARSLRVAYPDLTIVAVDYSHLSTGLHDPSFTRTVVHRPWSELDLNLFSREVGSVLDAGHIWISCLDLEAKWLAKQFGPDCRNLLVPPPRAFNRVRKPLIPAAKSLGMVIPPSIPMAAGSIDVHRFCRRHGWAVWVKGPEYEARRATSWMSLLAASETLGATWNSDRTFVQAHVQGAEKSIAFIAFRGRLVDAVVMEKTQVTAEGKTWSGRVLPLDDGRRRQLRDVVRRLAWTGGGEVECVVDDDGSWWVLDWNPRFPAWIHGATLSGCNLPAQLVATCEGWAGPVAETTSDAGFVRVVYELPARTRLPDAAVLTELPGRGSKHPSGMPALAQRVGGRRSSIAVNAGDASVLTDLGIVVSSVPYTPLRVLLPTVAARQFAVSADLAERVGRQLGIPCRVSYSVKTDPDPRLLALARSHGFSAEVINQAEIEAAVAAGWPPSEMVVNGPAKSWPAVPSPVRPRDVAAWFHDSVESLRLEAQGDRAEMLAIRLRPIGVESRFGVSLAKPQLFARAAAEIRRLRPKTMALLTHQASSVIGIERWTRVMSAMVAWAVALQADTSVPVVGLDFGGGWAPGDFEACAGDLIIQLGCQARRELQRLEWIAVEPGKAIVQPSKALVATVVELRNVELGAREVVVDASVAELPLAHDQPRAAYWRIDGQWRVGEVGTARMLGRICMEDDVLGWGFAVPRDLQVGDLVAIGDAGAYDESMAYRFGRG